MALSNDCGYAVVPIECLYIAVFAIRQYLASRRYG